MEQALIKLGLSDKEARVYIALLELSKDTVQNIGKKSHVNRATTYVILEKLMELGLASRLEQDKRTLFIAENPRELANIIESEKRLLNERQRELDETMTQLQAIYNAQKDKPIVRFFEGADGLEALENIGYDELTNRSELLAIMPIDKIESLFPEKRKKSVSQRVKKGIHSRVIYTRSSGPVDDDRNRAELRTARYIPREKLPIDATISIYPEWGIKLFYFSDSNPHGVLIQSSDLARNFKQFFELAWKGAE